ncbi:MAG: (d)CMP kinase [Planctomycetaceae bacterium]|jgi:CMP/dCMP kinase|nr:(d)CMP kinase [Planctomycetaceae bacterium]MBT6848613.1 (d)CMP kinase [Planctomycetaceae bacterium]
MIVTIDGPAGAGKSTVARMVADQLGFMFLDTGAMYRCVALLAHENKIAWENEDAIGELGRTLAYFADHDKVFIAGEDVTQTIRSPEVTATVHRAADNVQVRESLVKLQRQLASGNNVVTEGRDQGTLAFPDAECKIYLSASPTERAQRRVDQLNANGGDVTLAEILEQQTIRDEQDEARELGGLQAADDALFVVTDGMNVMEVVEHIERLVRIRENDSV